MAASVSSAFRHATSCAAAHVDRLHEAAQHIDEDGMRAKADDADRIRAVWKYQRDHAGMRDTADLNDPHALSKDQPPRTETDTCGLGASSLQVFAAEFRDEAAIKEQNKQQLLTWNGELLAGKAAAQAAQRAADEAYAAYNAAVVQAAEEAESQWDTEAKAAQRALLLEQKAQIRDRKRREAAERMAELEADQRHHAAMQQSALMCEDAAQGYNASNPNRPRPDHFKGFSQDEIRDIHLAQEEQIQAKADAAAAARAADAAYVQFGAHVAAAAEEADRAAAAAAAEEARALQAAQRRQQREAARRRALEDAQRKAPEDAYGGGFMAGFGKSHR